MADFIVGALLLILVGAAIAYIAKERKKGVKCIGCPDGATCASKNKAGGCGCNIDLQEAEAQIRQALRDEQGK